LVSPNENKSFAPDENADTVEIVMKSKCLHDLMIAYEIDDILGKAVKNKLLDYKEINRLRMEMLNY